MVRLRLVEGIPKYAGPSEAELIHKTVPILTRAYDQRRARYIKTSFAQPWTRDDFLAYLEKDCDYLHISAHGAKIDGHGEFYVRPNATIRARDISDLEIKATVVFLNACRTWSEDLKDAFLQAMDNNDACYIAPSNDVPFDEAYLVALLFYKSLLLDRRTPWRSLVFANTLPRTSSRYWYRKKSE